MITNIALNFQLHDCSSLLGVSVDEMGKALVKGTTYMYQKGKFILF